VALDKGRLAHSAVSDQDELERRHTRILLVLQRETKGQPRKHHPPLAETRAKLLRRREKKKERPQKSQRRGASVKLRSVSLLRGPSKRSRAAQACFAPGNRAKPFLKKREPAALPLLRPHTPRFAQLAGDATTRNFRSRHHDHETQDKEKTTQPPATGSS
jgi:hypothetical protein